MMTNIDFKQDYKTMSKTYPPSAEIENTVQINEAKYDSMYQGSINQPEIFWAVQAKRLHWYKVPTKIKNTSFEGDVSIKWYEDGMLNACYNCVDRHLPEKENDIALIFEGDEPSDDRKVTYGQLKTEVCKLANASSSTCR